MGFVFPRICQICESERATVAEGFVCAQCWAQIRFIRPPFCQKCGLPYEGEITGPFECGNCREMNLKFSFARSAVAARGVVLEVIHRYKYQRALWFEPFLADLLIREAAPELRRGGWQCLVPVPLHPTKLREREFNQAVRLGGHLSEATQIPLREDLLERVVPTFTQTLLSREERAANVRKAFVARQGAVLNGERVVVVDDVPHHRSDRERLCPGVAEGRRGRSLRLDSCSRTLNIIGRKWLRIFLRRSRWASKRPSRP